MQVVLPMDKGIRRSIFVTGAASGIGRAACMLFAERGWFVGASDVDQAGLQSLVAELGGEEVCHAVVLDTARAAGPHSEMHALCCRSAVS